MGIYELTKNSRFSKKTQSILLVSILLVSFTSLELFVMIDADHNEITKSLPAGSQMISFRDKTNHDTTASISGEITDATTLSLTVTDADGDLDITELDFVFVRVNSTSSGPAFARTILNETGVNTAVFTGVITLSSDTTTGSTLEASERDDIEMCYEAHPLLQLTGCDLVSEGTPLGLARLMATVDLATPGDVSITDVLVTEDDLVNFPFRPITHIAEISFSNGATQTPGTDMEVTITYANADLRGESAELIRMFYKEPMLGWKVIRERNTDGLNDDPAIRTITSVPDQAGFFPGLFGGVTQGQFMLGIGDSIGGGGGGGLVRPSLVVNALAGIGGAGGGADGSPPLVELSELVKYSHLGIPLEIEQMVLNHDSTVPISPMELGLFENFDYPMTINDNGFVLGGFTSTLETQTIKTDSATVIKFILYETTKIQHLSFYTNLRDANSQIHQSDTQILYNDGQPLQIIDPNGFFSDVSVTINEINENKKEAVYEITFAKPMPTSDVIIRAWDPYFNSRDAFILDAFEVVSGIIEETPIPTYDEPVIEELQSQTIPKWIKNNAAWWADQQIADSDFVSGIQYLIKNGIINVTVVEGGTSSESTEIPEWIKNNAAWWADSLITDDEFLNAMQWLVANGVIQI